MPRIRKGLAQNPQPRLSCCWRETPGTSISWGWRVVSFYHLGNERRFCETRLTADGSGYELVIVEDGREHVEQFDNVPDLLSREHELLAVWRAQGWRNATSAPHGSPAVSPARD
jgi:hypothetical protein